MSLKERITDDMRASMKERDAVRTSTLRMLMAAIKNAEVQGAQARELSDDEVLDVVSREAKGRKSAALDLQRSGHLGVSIVRA